MQNLLFCGDNLDILRDYIADETVDLVYLDPPFKSDQNYNLLFKEKTGAKSSSQILAFEDTWEWNQEAQRNFIAVKDAGGKLSEAMSQFRILLGETDMLAYLAMMAPRLVELRRVLKPSGSIYLHCDPTASHYLKMLMDAVFGPQFFRNEIMWRRSRGHSDRTLSKYGANHDVILYYAKSASWLFNRKHHEKEISAPKTHDLYVHTDGKLYRKGDCIAPGGRGPRYEWNGFVRNWRFSLEKRKELEEKGLIVYSKNGMPRVLRLVDPERGHPLQDTWTDIDPPNSGSGESLGYPTQKPQVLLERIIESSSSVGDIVLDPFCGCGTAIEAAHKLRRTWIGIDITEIAIEVVEKRLARAGIESDSYKLIIEPRTFSSAEALAMQDPFQFQDWVVRKLGGVVSRSRSGDRGVDGRLYFKDESSGPLRPIVVSVKGGKRISPVFVREVQGTLDRERAPMGILVTVRQPTKQMLRDAASSGRYSGLCGSFPRTQIITIKDILNGTPLDLPPIERIGQTGKRAAAAVVGRDQMKFPGMA